MKRPWDDEAQAFSTLTMGLPSSPAWRRRDLAAHAFLRAEQPARRIAEEDHADLRRRPCPHRPAPPSPPRRPARADSYPGTCRTRVIPVPPIVTLRIVHPPKMLCGPAALQAAKPSEARKSRAAPFASAAGIHARRAARRSRHLDGGIAQRRPPGDPVRHHGRVAPLRLSCEVDERRGPAAGALAVVPLGIQHLRE